MVKQEEKKKTMGIPMGYQKLIILGIVILFVGSIINVSKGYAGTPADDDSKRAWDDYHDGQRMIQTTAEIIMYIGLLLFSIGMVTGAIKDEDLNPYVRLGMMIAFGWIIARVIGATILF